VDGWRQGWTAAAVKERGAIAEAEVFGVLLMRAVVVYFPDLCDKEISGFGEHYVISV
jgi:hypothetical protein